MATIGTYLYTAFKGKFVGEDAYGNRYYQARAEKTSASDRKKRWVVYKGLAEPSKVTPEWHGWLHYTTDILPADKTTVRYAWMRAPEPNLTGTTLAYVPPGHVNRGGERAASAADVKAWKP